VDGDIVRRRSSSSTRSASAPRRRPRCAGLTSRTAPSIRLLRSASADPLQQCSEHAIRVEVLLGDLARPCCVTCVRGAECCRRPQQPRLHPRRDETGPTSR
jgi:hypothetical protein